MRIVTHRAAGVDKLLRVEAEGCAIHITVGLHDADGNVYTSVEIEPLQPDDDLDVWFVRGQATSVVLNGGPQKMSGDHGGRSLAAEDRPGPAGNGRGRELTAN